MKICNYFTLQNNNNNNQTYRNENAAEKTSKNGKVLPDSTTLLISPTISSVGEATRYFSTFSCSPTPLSRRRSLCESSNAAKNHQQWCDDDDDRCQQHGLPLTIRLLSSIRAVADIKIIFLSFQRALSSFPTNSRTNTVSLLSICVIRLAAVFQSEKLWRSQLFVT